MKQIRMACAQINTTVGDIEGNCSKILGCIRQAEKEGVDIISFPELTITGYPPEDMLLSPEFIDKNLAGLAELKNHIGDIVVVLGFVNRIGSCLYNGASVIYKRKEVVSYHKMLLPNYGVFDEKRYFAAGGKISSFIFSSVHFGVSICEDIWGPGGPVRLLAGDGVSCIININASPYHVRKIMEREAGIRAVCLENSVAVCYTNLVGGQDELVFDGSSFIMESRGEVRASGESFEEQLLVADLLLPLSVDGDSKAVRIEPDGCVERNIIGTVKRSSYSCEEEVYRALTMGLRDYVVKNGFKKVVLGLSGGIDSAAVAAIAVDALGREDVLAVFMPSRYSSDESLQDACQIAANLGLELLNISIDSLFAGYLATLSGAFDGRDADITEENLQARIRGNILMALSNKFGHLVLTTGNKSELAVGYSTLYGDMAGGFAVLKDVYKTFVYRIAEYRNSTGMVIPQRVISKAPTAELRPGQKDQDSLPAYELLDAILLHYIEDRMDIPGIAACGFDEGTVRQVVAMVDGSEYKRRQSPPGIRITTMAFGRDRRMPITGSCRVKY